MTWGEAARRTTLLAVLLATWACVPVDPPGFVQGTGSIEGAVLDQTGSPVEGARVYVKGDLSLATMSDGGGGFTLEAVPAGRQTLVALGEEGFGGVSNVPVFGGTSSFVSVALTSTGRLLGVVQTAEAEPIPGAVVRLEGTSFATLTDEAGTFEMGGVVPACHTLVATAEGFRAATVEDVCIQEGEALTMAPVMLVEVGVDGCDGCDECDEHEECVAGVCVSAEGGEPETCNGLDDDGDGIADDGIVAFSGTAEGRCEVTVAVCLGGEMEVVLEGVEPHPETCDDGLDDDCDGETDEGCEPTGVLLFHAADLQGGGQEVYSTPWGTWAPQALTDCDGACYLADVTADGDAFLYLALTPGSGTSARVWLASLDEASHVDLGIDAVGGWARLTSDEGTVLYQASDGDGAMVVRYLDIVTGLGGVLFDPAEVLAVGASLQGLAVVPGGARIAVGLTTSQDTSSSDIALLTAGGILEQLLTTAEGCDAYPMASSDGGTIFWRHEEGPCSIDGGATIVALPLQGEGAPAEVVAGLGVLPTSTSTDGRLLVFEKLVGGQWDLFAYDLVRATSIRLTESGTTSEGNGTIRADHPGMIDVDDDGRADWLD